MSDHIASPFKAAKCPICGHCLRFCDDGDGAVYWCPHCGSARLSDDDTPNLAGEHGGSAAFAGLSPHGEDLS